MNSSASELGLTLKKWLYFRHFLYQVIYTFLIFMAYLLIVIKTILKTKNEHVGVRVRIRVGYKH